MYLVRGVCGHPDGEVVVRVPVGHVKSAAIDVRQPIGTLQMKHLQNFSLFGPDACRLLDKLADLALELLALPDPAKKRVAPAICGVGGFVVVGQPNHRCC